MIMMITSSILTILHEKFVISPFFGIITGNVSFSLLADYIIDIPFLTFEIIPDRFGIIRSITVFKNGLSGFHSQRIRHTTSKYRTAVHIHGNDLRTQFYTLIIYLPIPIKMCISSFLKNDRVICRINYRCIQRLFFGRLSNN